MESMERRACGEIEGRERPTDVDGVEAGLLGRQRRVDDAEVEREARHVDRAAAAQPLRERLLLLV